MRFTAFRILLGDFGAVDGTHLTLGGAWASGTGGGRSGGGGQDQGRRKGGGRREDCLGLALALWIFLARDRAGARGGAGCAGALVVDILCGSGSSSDDNDFLFAIDILCGGGCGTIVSGIADRLRIVFGLDNDLLFNVLVAGDAVQCMLI